MGLDAGLGQALLRTRMNRKDDGDLRGDRVNRAEELGELFGGIHVRRTVESEDGEALPLGAVFQSEIGADGGLLCDGKKMAQGVDHHVADEIDGLARTAFFEEM